MLELAPSWGLRLATLSLRLESPTRLFMLRRGIGFETFKRRGWLIFGLNSLACDLDLEIGCDLAHDLHESQLWRLALVVALHLKERYQEKYVVKIGMQSPRASRTYVRISIYDMRKIGISAAQGPKTKTVSVFCKSILGTTTLFLTLRAILGTTFFFPRPSGDFRYNNRFFLTLRAILGPTGVFFSRPSGLFEYTNVFQA